VGRTRRAVDVKKEGVGGSLSANPEPGARRRAVAGEPDRVNEGRGWMGLEDRGFVVAALSSEQTTLDKRVDFSLAKLDADAAEASPPSHSVKAHPLGAGGS